jgi:thiol:disulfide interchange protein DsbD
MHKLFQTIISCVRAAAAIMVAALLLTPLAGMADDFLDPEVAFRLSAKMVDATTAEVHYKIADGYYMYRERFAFKAEGATLGEPAIPPGKVKFDETFQKEVETYHGGVTIRLPVQASGPFLLKVTGQGCADKGLCYPPMTSDIRLTPAAAGSASAVQISSGAAGPADGADSDMGKIAASLKSGRLLSIMPLFLLLGLGLSFTPCVLPMVPILSSIIVGEGERTSRKRALLLSLAYSAGMALVYTALGIAAGLAGEGLAASLQNPWVLSGFALLIAILSLSMFGVYQLQMPAAIQSRLAGASSRQSAGRLTGVFVMGAISALIVGPCVAAPLAGALLYISQTRDVVVGGGALFAMAAGMSVPLLLVGVSAGSLLPRAGVWMEGVKRFFGVLMLALAVWIVAPVTPGWAPMLGWALLGLGYGIYLLRSLRGGMAMKAAGILFLALGAVQLVGAATGGRDPLEPLAHLRGAATGPQFSRIKSVEQLDDVLARANGKTVMLDFYADWCVSCKEMEKLTFSDPRVRAKLADIVLLQADVTANDAADKALLKRFSLFGPPGIIFFDGNGREIPDGRVIGYQDADKFLRSLERAARS